MPRPSPPPSSPVNQVDDLQPPHTFYTYLPPLDSLPSVPLGIDALSVAVNSCLRRLQSVCEVCHFLGETRPIQIILTHPRGGRWDEVDYHVNDATRCPWRCVHPSSSYDVFSGQVHRSFRASSPGGGRWSVCTHCAEPWDTTDPHERCVFGDSLFKLAFMIWEDRPTRDRVFSFLHTKVALEIPDLPTRTHYAYWLGRNIFPSLPTLSNIHILVVTYRILRRSAWLLWLVS